MDIIFVQCKNEITSKVAEILGGIDQDQYYFVVLPLDTKLLTKYELVEIIREADGN